MDTKDFLALAVKIVDDMDSKFEFIRKRDELLSMTQLLEELGELTKEVNRRKLRGEEPKMEDLEEEFADVFILFAKLADIFNVDIEKATLEKIEVIKKRHGL